MKPELMAVILIGIIVAFILIVTIIRNIISKKRDRNSVRPRLNIIHEEQKNKPIRILLKNTGHGPAKIDSFEVRLNNISSNGINATTLDEAIRQVGIHGLDIICYTPNVGDTLSVNESHFLLEANPINSVEHEKICAALSRLTFKIKYRSLYNETFWL